MDDDDPIQDLDKLNERVYAQLFLTPSSDPWLGLVQDEVGRRSPDLAPAHW